MTKRKMTVDDFFGKLDWEGGYHDLALYGLNPKELADKKLAALWASYLEQYEVLDVIVKQIEELRPC